MWRNLHAIFGLMTLVMTLVLSLTGAILATSPILDALRSETQELNGVSVADALTRIMKVNPALELEKLKVLPSGIIEIAGYLDGGKVKHWADINSGELLTVPEKSPFYEWVRDLHRAFMLGESGRKLAFVTALAMLLICISGTFLLLRRMGGWQRFFAPTTGRASNKIHAWMARIVLLPLMVTVVSGFYLSTTTMGLVSSGTETSVRYPESLEELSPVAPYLLSGLIELPLSNVSEIVFPIPEDWFDVFAVKTHSSYVFFDQFAGEKLAEQSFSITQKIFNIFTLLHTAEGAALWGVIAGISVLSVPVFAVTGFLIWLKRVSRKTVRSKHQITNDLAEIVIVVGSENNATWGFAIALRDALLRHKFLVHLCAMDDLGASYKKAKQLLVLTSTYGDGDAPQNARKFEKRLQGLPLNQLPKFAVLGFGDKAFPKFCKYAYTAQSSLTRTHRMPLLPLFEVNKQSAQAFKQWTQMLGSALGIELAVEYNPMRAKTQRLVLQDKKVFGQDLQQPTAVLRFEAERTVEKGFRSNTEIVPDHEAGDFAAIYPPNSDVARRYSLASCKREQCVEICVARQAGGVCSTYLNTLSIGDTIEVAIEPNAHFKAPTKKQQPIVMIGAGTGIAPFAGMIRNNMRHQHIDLFWGNRHPKSDFLYEHDIKDWLSDNRLKNFYPAFSRTEKPAYVQDIMRDRTHYLSDLVRQGATIMVCGSHAMAEGVRAELENIASLVGLSVTELKRRGRYLEDIY